MTEKSPEPKYSQGKTPTMYQIQAFYFCRRHGAHLKLVDPVGSTLELCRRPLTFDLRRPGATVDDSDSSSSANEAIMTDR